MDGKLSLQLGNVGIAEPRVRVRDRPSQATAVPSSSAFHSIPTTIHRWSFALFQVPGDDLTPRQVGSRLLLRLRLARPRTLWNANKLR